MAHDAVLVVGAGPTGLVFALSMARRGAAVRIIDKNDGPARASRAMVVHARNLEFYRQFGFAEEVVDGGIKVERLHVREHGTEVGSWELADAGAGLSPYPFLLCYPQDDHERLLGAKLREAGVEVEWRTSLTTLTQDADGVEATLERDGTTERCRAPYVFGADGAHSAVRHALGLGFPGGTYDQVFYVADVALAEGGPDMVMAMDKRGFALNLPVRSTGSHRLIGLVPPEQADKTDLQFADIQDHAEALAGVSVRGVNWFSRYHVHHRVASHFRAGRCFIGGDAGHVHSPVGGQGMNTGIGDAVNLAWKVADVARGRAGAQILDSYEPERIGFARKLVATTDQVFKGAAGRGGGAELFRTVVMGHVVPFLLGFTVARRQLFETVSQVRIAYGDSALSRGKAGEIEGGDRLPWVEEADNFAPLRSLDWQIHVFGTATPGLEEAAGAVGVPVHEFAWSEAAGHAGFRENASYLVRPDGYVALADRNADPEALRDYAGAMGLRALAA